MLRNPHSTPRRGSRRPCAATRRLNPARACYAVEPRRTCLEDAIGCLPSVANMWQQNVSGLDKADEKRKTQKAKRAENAESKRSVRCLSRR